ncbi:hypothetical protein FRC17_002285 [Serendipita sp. 399]|nr:hypothetical protein FRC17_002285 [Serendipita sp. 399]
MTVETPLPWRQLGVLLLMNTAEPMTAAVIYPFIAQLVEELHITGGQRSSVGYYVGLVESLFFLTEALFVLQWGRLSDRIGRKPVLLIGLSGLTLSMLSFGLSHTFFGIVISRALAGALNGNIGILKSAVGEITDETNKARAFSYLPLVWCLGSTISPIIGGYFSHPAEHFGGVFATDFWKHNPYFLPCSISAAYSLLCSVLGLWFLEETHPSFRRPDKGKYIRLSGAEENILTPMQEIGGPYSSQAEPQEDLLQPVKPRTDFRHLCTKKVLISVLNYGVLALLDIALQALLPVFLATSLRFSPSSIGSTLGIMGLVNGAFQILLFVPIHRRIGTRNVFMVGMAAFLVIFAIFPLIEKEYALNSRVTPRIYVLLTIIVVLCPVESMSFNVIFVYVQAASPSRSALGATNGIAQTAASIARAIGPASTTAFYAFSSHHPDILGGFLVYFVLGFATLLGGIIACTLPTEPWPSQEQDAIKL